jgi:hypothetical protein
MTHAIPRPTALALALALVGALLCGCSHTGEEERLAGYWEGALPLPTTGDALPIAYDFRAGDGLTVTVGLGDNRTVTEWDRWEVHSADGGDLVLYIYRGDGRVFSTLVRHTSEGGLILWDPGTEESTAAHVRRVGGGTSAAGDGPAEGPGGEPGGTAPPADGD